MRNYLKSSLWLMLTVVVLLVALKWLPAINIGGHELRQVDLLGDLTRVNEDIPTVACDSMVVAIPAIEPVAQEESCPKDTAFIENFEDSTLRGMTHFYQALNRLYSNYHEEGVVRIAFFGDSFIEGDIFTGDLRDFLQKQFGGCGVGFVPITSNTSKFRTTVRHSFDGWESHCMTDKTDFDKSKQGISGHYFIPTDGAWVELSGIGKRSSLLDSCSTASVFFYCDSSVSISARVNHGEEQLFCAESQGKVDQIKLTGKIGSIRWEIDSCDSTALFYGATMDCTRGILLDNFSVRGNSGMSLRGISQEKLRQFNDLRPYDLIILEYGLNVATKYGYDYDGYKQGMISTIEHLKRCFPQAGILLFSVPDRDYKTADGDMRTMPGVKNLVRYQQKIAKEAGIAFWNLFEAMGGEGSMVKMVGSKPAMANYDYTHINARGGKHLAGLFFEALMHDKELFDKKNRYEKK